MNKTTLKSWFTRGKKPTASQFADWMDSYWHKDEKLGASAMDASFISAINAKAEQTALDTANAAIASGVSRIKDLEDIQVLKITAMERTNGCIYLRVNKDDYDIASAVASKKRLPIWAWLNNNDCDSGPDNVGTQSTTVVAGYEPVYFKIGSNSEDIPVCYKYGTNYQLMLKDIHSKSLLIDASYYASEYVVAIGITPEKEVPDTIIPANALVIDSLTADYSATADTADNVRINSVDTAGSHFVLPLASTMTEDKNIKVYLGADSANALTIDNAGTDSSVEKGGSAECFYSATLGVWIVDVIEKEADDNTSGAVLQSFVAFKAGWAKSYYSSGYKYVRVATIRPNGGTIPNKTYCSFSTFSGSFGSFGVFKGSYSLSYEAQKGGAFLCNNFNTNNDSKISCSDFFAVVKDYSGYNLVIEIWKKMNDSYDSWFFGLEMLGENVTITFDNNNYSGATGLKQTLKPAVGTNDITGVLDPLLSESDSGISESILSLNPTSLVAISTAATQTPVTSFTTVVSKDWTPTIDSNGFITIPTAGYLEISGFLTIEAVGGTTNSRKAIINHKDSNNNVTMISRSEVYLSSTSTDGKKKSSCPISALIQVASGDSIQICGYTDDNTANIYASSTVILKLKS